MPCANNIKRSSRNEAGLDDVGVGGGDDDGQEKDTDYQG
jgi:hypothetical protein